MLDSVDYFHSGSRLSSCLTFLLPELKRLRAYSKRLPSVKTAKSMSRTSQDTSQKDISSHEQERDHACNVHKEQIEECHCDDPIEVEMWVEFQFQNEWSLEAGTSAQDDMTWKQRCSTSTLKRRWDDFQRLEAQQKRADALSIRDTPALEECGAANLSRKQFLKEVLEVHPDKGGTAEDFCHLLARHRRY